MEQATATLKNYRQSPRKVRHVADLVRGKKVADALSVLSFLPKRASLPIATLIKSAVANAKNLNIQIDALKVGELRVDGGVTMQRRRPMSRGRAFPIKKRTSHITLVLRTSENKKEKIKDKKEALKKGAKE